MPHETQRMSQLLEYDFFIYAIVGIVLLSISAAVIGTYIITRRMVAIPGGVTHACFGGLGLGYFLGISPLFMAGVFAIASSLGVELMSHRFKLRDDSAIAVVWAVGMAIGVLFIFMTPGYVPELNSFLFGSILTVTPADLLNMLIYNVLLLAFFAWKYKEIVVCAFDRDFAAVNGLPVRFITTIMTVFVAIGIVLTIKLVGVMMLLSVLSLPMMTAEVFCRRYHTIMFASMAISLIVSLSGLFLSTIIDVPCSAVIVLMMAVTFFLAKAIKALR